MSAVRVWHLGFVVAVGCSSVQRGVAGAMHRVQLRVIAGGAVVIPAQPEVRESARHMAPDLQE